MRPIIALLLVAACTSPAAPAAVDVDLDPVGTWKVDGSFVQPGTCGPGADYTWKDGFIVTPNDAGDGVDIIDIFRAMPVVASVGCSDTACTMLAIETLPADGGGQIQAVTVLTMTENNRVTGHGRITVTGDRNCYVDFTEAGSRGPIQPPE